MPLQHATYWLIPTQVWRPHSCCARCRGGPLYKKGVRELRLEIVWCTVSSHDAARYVLRPGDVTQRDAAHVIQFQAFRQPGVDEHKRLP